MIFKINCLVMSLTLKYLSVWNLTSLQRHLLAHNVVKVTKINSDQICTQHEGRWLDYTLLTSLSHTHTSNFGKPLELPNNYLVITNYASRVWWIFNHLMTHCLIFVILCACTCVLSKPFINLNSKCYLFFIFSLLSQQVK